METMRPQDAILIVEDDEGQLLLIKENLRASGILNDIVETHDGQEALDYLYHRGAYQAVPASAEAPKPGLILLDIKMPKVDGYAVLQQLRADPNFRTIPVIMLTSTDDQAEINRCYALGANGYLVKPLRYNEFQERIKMLGVYLDSLRLPS